MVMNNKQFYVLLKSKLIAGLNANTMAEKIKCETVLLKISKEISVDIESVEKFLGITANPEFTHIKINGGKYA